MGSTLRAWFTSLTLTAALGLCATTTYAAELAHKLSAGDEFQIQLAADPQISPDGKRIVYVRSFADPMTDKRYSNLWIVNADGTAHQPLTSGNEGDSSPRWSPDGARLAYLSDKDGKQQLYVRWMDTGQTARLTNLDEGPGEIDWSADGKYLSFSALVTTKGPQIAELPAPPSGAKWAEPPTAYDRLVYRFNGVGYLKNGYRQLFVVSADGGTPRQLTSDDFPNGGDPLTANRAVWSKDGRYLIVSINRHPDADLEPFDSEVYEVSVADGTLRALTHRKGPDDEPALSPDGRWIAYTGFDDRYQGHQTRKLYVMARDGTGSHAVSDALDRDIQSPRWAPDNSGVYFLYDDEGDTKLGFVSVGGKVRKLADHVASTESAYGGGSFSVSRSGAIAFTSGTATVPGNVALWSRGEPRTLTALNQELLAQKPPGARGGDLVRVIQRPAADPGLDRQAAGLRPGEEVPAHPRDPRRSVRQLRRSLRFRKAGVRRARLRRLLRQPARQHQLRRGVRQPHPSRLSRRRFLRPQQRRRRRGRQGIHRHGQPVRHRRQRRRRADVLDDRQHRPLSCRGVAVPGDQLVQLRAHLGHPLHHQVLVPGPSLG